LNRFWWRCTGYSLCDATGWAALAARRTSMSQNR
jgi:hypothetical protein